MSKVFDPSFARIIIRLLYFQIQDKLGGGFQRFQSFSGQVTEMNIWDYVIDDGNIKRMAECRGDFSTFKGNILFWNPLNWTINGAVNTSNIKYEDLCNEPAEKNFIIIPQQQSIRISRKICEKLGKT